MEKDKAFLRAYLLNLGLRELLKYLGNISEERYPKLRPVLMECVDLCAEAEKQYGVNFKGQFFRDENSLRFYLGLDSHLTDESKKLYQRKESNGKHVYRN